MASSSKSSLLHSSLNNPSSKTKSSGFTEAERMAAAWSVLEQRDHKNPKHDSSICHGESITRGQRGGEGDRWRNRDEAPRQNRGSKFSDRTSKYEHSSNRPRESDDWEHSYPNRPTYQVNDRPSPTYSPYRGNSTEAEVNREQLLEKIQQRSSGSYHNDRWERDKIRSDSRSPSRRSSIHARSSTTRSRSRSRSRDRNLTSKWTHDKFNSRRSPSPDKGYASRQGEKEPYRPPSPTWVSRAGGVAIIRKKLADIG